MKSHIFWLLIWISVLGVMAQPGSAALAADAAQTATMPAATVQPPPPPVDGSNPQAKPPMTDGRLPQRPLILAGSEAAGVNAATTLTIDVWYGDSQRFGHLGVPQPWINILGNVSGPNLVTELAYTLNGGAEQPLGMGADGFRLVRAGDFNIEIDSADLNDGANQIMIKATDSMATTVFKAVTIQYDAGNIWPPNHVATWTSADIQVDAQVVDGKWSAQNGVARPLELGYDRLLAIGDLTWPDYEVEVPITVHSLDPEGYCGINNGPGVGLVLRWQGHYLTDDDQAIGRQPRTGWSNLGALGWYHWGHNGNCVPGGPEALQFKGYGGATSIGNGYDSSHQLEFNTPYIFKLSVESTTDPAYYRFKVWKAADPEPVQWNLYGVGAAGGPDAGSLLLVAHWVDATFGQVTVTPLNTTTYTLITNSTGAGSVVRTPDKAVYLQNEAVTLTAAPDSGWVFKEWQGDVPAGSVDATLNLSMAADKTITALFEKAPEYSLTASVIGQGSVSKTPDQPGYTENMTVTLTATPDDGWVFKAWSGDVPPASASPVLTLTMDGDKVVTALFEQKPPNQYSLSAAVIGQGQVNKTPDQPSYTENMAVTLTATPDNGWVFKAWSGDVPAGGTEADVTLTMDGDKSVTAIFEQRIFMFLPVITNP